MTYHKTTRIERIAEKRSSKKLVLSLVFSALVIISLALWGIPALISMSIFISNLTGHPESLVNQTTNTPLFPPSLEPVTEATNSSPIALRGYSDPKTKIELFVNGIPQGNTVSDNAGQFIFSEVTLETGTNSLWVKAKIGAKESGNSKILTVVYKKSAPKLDLSNPPDNTTVTGDKKEILISGTTDANNSVTINNHIVIVNPNGSFFYNYPLNDGDNMLKITASDSAGNQTTIERKVKYSGNG